MKTILRIMICSAAVLSAGGFQSCLKEKDCPRKPAVFVAVQDKNYDNAAETGQAVDENLPLRQYVGSMNVSYTVVGNTTPSLRQTLIPTGNDKTLMLAPGALPAGNYKISVTGRPVSVPVAPGTDEPLVELHPQQTESDDIYIGTGTGNLPPNADRTILLKRTKGKLALSLTNLPANIYKVEIRIAGVYKNVDTGLNYSGTTSVTKSFPITGVTDPLPLEMLLAPTDASGSTSAMIILYDDTNTPVEIFSNLTVNIVRNKVTQMELRYDPDANKYEIWVMLEGSWQQLHPLDINENGNLP